MFVCYNTILKLDLIIIIIQKYCEKYLKPDKDLNKSKTIKFVLDQLNNIRKTKDFKTLKSIFTLKKNYKIKDLKDWLNILCVNNFKLFSKYFKLDVEIDMKKGYKTYVNLLSKLENNKTKVDLKEPNKKISILFNLLFYDVIVGGMIEKIRAAAKTLIKHDIRRKPDTTIVLSDLSELYKKEKTRENLEILIKAVKDKSIYLKILAYDLCRSDSKREYTENYIEAWNNFIESNFRFDLKSRSTIQSIKTRYDKVFKSNTEEESKEKVPKLITQLKNKTSKLEKLKYTFIYLLISWTYRGDIYIKTFAKDKKFQDIAEEHKIFNMNFEILIDSSWTFLKDLEVFDSKFDELPHYNKYIIMLSELTNLFYYGGPEFESESELDPTYKQVPVSSSIDPKNVVFYFGTNLTTIQEIRSKKLILPQSSSNSLAVAHSFVSEVLAIYNFTPVTDLNSELWIPVPIRDYSHFPYEEEVLLVPKLNFLQDIINNKNKIKPEFINSGYKIKSEHYRTFIDSTGIAKDSISEDKIEDEIQIVHMSELSDIEERQSKIIEKK